MTWTKSRIALGLASLLLAMPGAAAAQTVAKLIVAPIQFRLETGGKGQIVVDLRDDSGRALESESAGVRFQSSDTNVVAVTGSGSVRATGIGRAEILVRAGAQSRRIPVTVDAAPTLIGSAPATSRTQPATPPVTAVPTPPASQPPVTATASAPSAAVGPAVMSASIEPVNIQLLASERFRPTFKLHFADGTQVESRDVVWNTFGSAIGIDPQSGEVIGVAPGSGVLGGRYGSTSISASVTVTVVESNLVPTPDSLQLVTGEQDTVYLVVPAQGRRRVTQNLVWRTIDPSIMRVLSPSAGVVVAQSTGSTDLIVDGYGVTRRIPVKVSPRVARIEANAARGAAISLGTGGTYSSNARAIGTDGTTVIGSPMIWNIADTSLARVDVSGNVIGVREGKTTLTLDAPGLEQMSWPVTVQTARVALAFSRVGLQVGATKKVPIALRAPDGREFGAVTSARWTSSAPAVASIDASGTVTAHRAGRAMLTIATDGAGQDSVPVYVTGRGLVSGMIGAVRGIWQLMAANDTTPTLLLEANNGTFSQAVWSPDRTRIAATFEPLDKPNQPSVVVMDADGSNLTTLSPDTVFASDPSWSRDGASVLMVLRDPKVSAILRVALGSRAVTQITTSLDTKYRFPMPGADTGTVYVRAERGGVVDVARFRTSTATLQLMTTGKPREELMAQLRDGRILIAVDSSSRPRPATLQWATVGDAALQSATSVRVPAGLLITDISPGYDDATVIVVARVRSWPGASGAALVVLRIALDGADPTVLMLLSEKDNVTVRSN